jgi:hypothetical protein
MKRKRPTTEETLLKAAERARSGKNLACVEGDFGQFTEFMRELVAVPHSKIKDEMAAEKAKRRSTKRSSSRGPAS